MIVITEAAVLAALAIFSTSSLILRTKFSRVQEDHRVLTRALENYMMDYSELPASREGLESLERPTAYVGAVPGDPFHRGDRTDYLYLRPDLPGIAFVLVSTGPDGDYDIPNILRAYTDLPMDEFGNVPAETLRVAGLPPRTQTPAKEPLTRDEAAFWSTLGMDGPPRAPSAPDAEEEPDASESMPSRQDFERSILEYYIKNKSWSPNNPTQDGDIITVVRF